MRFNNYSEQDLIDEFYQCSDKAFDDLFEMRIKRFTLICRSMSVQTYYVNDIISTSYLKVKKYVSEPHQKKNIKNIDDYNNKVIKNVVI